MQPNECEVCGFVAKSPLGLGGHRRKHEAEARRAAAADAPAEPRPEEPAPQLPTEEAPRRPGGLMGRLRSFGRKAPAPGTPTKERAPRRPRSVGKRVALDEDISEVWGEIGQLLEGTAHYPTGRMLQFQSASVGLVLDQAVAGTLPDRLLFQPLARTKDRWEAVFAVVVPPLLTTAMTNTAREIEEARQVGDAERLGMLMARAATQRRMFEFTIRRMLISLAPQVAKVRKRKEEEAAAIAEAFPELGAGVDPLEAMLSMLFAPPQGGMNVDEPDHDPANGPPGDRPAYSMEV